MRRGSKVRFLKSLAAQSRDLFFVNAFSISLIRVVLLTFDNQGFSISRRCPLSQAKRRLAGRERMRPVGADVDLASIARGPTDVCGHLSSDVSCQP